LGPSHKCLTATLHGVFSQVVTSFGGAQAANASPKPPPSILDSPTRSPHDSSRTLNHPLQVYYAYGDHPPPYNPPDMPTASSALMPMLTSTNLDSRSLICHESIATIDIISSPFDPPSSNCPISIPTLSLGGDRATLPLTSGHHGVTWWPTIGPEVTCSALFFDYVSGIMSGECLVPFVLPFLLEI